MIKTVISVRMKPAGHLCLHINVDEDMWSKYCALCGDKSVHVMARDIILDRYKSYDNFKKAAEEGYRSYSQQLIKTITDFVGKHYDH